ncbi:GNAT family N-acetyltransferase [Myxococcus sp. Y35]|uniref:GNAT family N-acetyltransferase n=1 Tax=Pseudomyxococcus flavus TaxID=3115648 RepID=UPI003CF42A6C
MAHDTPTIVSALSADDVARHLPELAALLHDCVNTGACVSFVLPFPPTASEAFWRQKVLPAAQAGGLIVLVVKREGRIAGSVQLDCDTPPNQPHRAEVRKLLVHPDFRRQGIARALMVGLEDHARQRGRTLVTLDTRTGDSAEPLYASLGYQTAGVIPHFSFDPTGSRLDATTVMYKALAPHPASLAGMTRKKHSTR